ALTEGVLKAMFLTKLRIVTAVALAFVAVPLAGGVAVRIHAASARVAVVDVSSEPDQARGAAADQDRGLPKAADAKGEPNSLSGVWAKGDIKQAGLARLNFDVTPPGPRAPVE